MNELKDRYAELRECIEMMRATGVDRTQILQFSAVLNKSQPSNFAQKSQKRMLLELSKNKSFVKYIYQNEPHLVLWLTARTIMEHFSIFDLVCIEWTGKKYYVHLAISKSAA
jgi:hypothetical protein